MNKWQQQCWETVDWNLHDSEIARELKCSREAVRQQRAKRGERKAPTAVEDCVRDLHDADVRYATKKDMALAFGHGDDTVSEAIALLGWKRKVDYNKSSLITRPSAWRYPWDEVDWSKYDAEIARELGCSATTVTVTRRRWGKGPPAVDGRVRSGSLYGVDWEQFDWANMTNAEIATIVGALDSSIGRKRAELGKPPSPKANRRRTKGAGDG